MPLRSLFFGRWIRAAKVAGQTRHDAAPGAARCDPSSEAALAAAGLPAPPVADLLAAHGDVLRRIKLTYGADAAAFEADLLTVVRRYAGYVNLLPATADSYFCDPGGLLRLGLETGFYALQATDGQIFSGRAPISQRRHLEPRWRQATFIAGLCSALHRALNQVRVSDLHGAPWPAYRLPLTDWLQQQRRPRFVLHWLPEAEEVRALGLLALPHLLPGELLQHLAQDNHVVVPHLLAAVGGLPLYQEHNVLDQLVTHAAALVIARDVQARAGQPTASRHGAHLARHLVDACRQLLRANDAWVPNGERSRVWYAEDGLFLVWPNAAADIAAQLESDRLPGMPRQPADLLAILHDAGLVAPQPDAQCTWRIHPPAAKSALDAVKLASPAILLAVLAAPPTPLPCRLTAPRPAPTAPPPTAAPLPQQLALPVTPPAVDGVAPDPAWPRAVPPEAPPYFLQAPLRLDPVLRAALQEVIDTLCSDPVPACSVIAAGLFVPLAELEKRQLDSAMAVRALSRLKMLANAETGDGVTVLHTQGDARLRGIVIAARFVHGLDAGQAAPSRSARDRRDAHPKI